MKHLRIANSWALHKQIPFQVWVKAIITLSSHDFTFHGIVNLVRWLSALGCHRLQRSNIGRAVWRNCIFFRAQFNYWICLWCFLNAFACFSVFISVGSRVLSGITWSLFRFVPIAILIVCSDLIRYTALSKLIDFLNKMQVSIVNINISVQSK